MDDSEQDAEDLGREQPMVDHDVVEAPTQASEQPPDDAPGRRGAALVAAVTLAVVFAVAAAALAVLLAQRSNDSGTEDLRAAAGRFGEALVTYDYHDPSAHRDAVLGFATGSFREEYETAFDQGLSKLITEVKAVSTGYIKDVYLSAVDQERAQAIVVVDIEHQGTSGPSTLHDVYFRLTMVQVGGEWKVDQVTDLNFDTGGGSSGTGATAPGGTASTTTSIP